MTFALNVSILAAKFGFGFGDVEGGFDYGVGGEGDAVDAGFDQETGELWIV